MIKTKRERIEVIMREKLAKYEQIRQDIIHKIESMNTGPTRSFRRKMNCAHPMG